MESGSPPDRGEGGETIGLAGFHAVSVPVLLRYLARLDTMLDALAAFARRAGRSEGELLATALADDMFDLRRQVLIAANFSMRALAPVAPALARLERAEGETLSDLRARIGERMAALEALDPASIDAAEGMIVSERAGEAIVEADALTFVTQYALPNFFFHLMTAYAIMRRIGVPLGKADFDGFHTYPAGFRFR